MLWRLRQGGNTLITDIFAVAGESTPFPATGNPTFTGSTVAG